MEWQVRDEGGGGVNKGVMGAGRTLFGLGVAGSRLGRVWWWTFSGSGSGSVMDSAAIVFGVHVGLRM